MTVAAIVAGVLLAAYYSVLRWAYRSAEEEPFADAVLDNGGGPPLDLDDLLATAEAFDAALQEQPLGVVTVEEDVEGVVWVLVDGSPRAILSRDAYQKMLAASEDDR